METNKVEVAPEPLAILYEEYGGKSQIIMAIEEMSELTKELTKYLRGKGNMIHIKEEAADVFVTVMGVKQLFGITNEDIDKEVKFKLKRALDEIYNKK
jgi:NTP pyrophosphatase (non-canonical NTP hydrolase)